MRLFPLLFFSLCYPAFAAEFRAEVLDQDGKRLPARVYLQHEDGRWFFPQSVSPKGSAVYYKKQRREKSVEMHTTLSAHPFTVSLPDGKYTLTVERGKEYRPKVERFEVRGKAVRLKVKLERWVNMAARGWFSGDTHVHRTLADLPNVMLAEDLNVAFPLTQWVTRAYDAPAKTPRGPDHNAGYQLIKVDATHVIHPRNTEYEIFTVDGKRHMLGAVFVLNHQSSFPMGAPPVGPIAERARKEGALLELDKHNWPWSMAIIPLMNVDLFELTNNHVWRTEFAFTDWAEPAPAYMKVDYGGAKSTELGWVLFGFKNYYALLNCGFKMRPTGGTANGVHPVPLGFGRVYVHLPKGFNYTDWVRGLDAGRSFVTTGPMLLATANGRPPGHRFRWEQPDTLRLQGSVLSEMPLRTIEIVVNGEVVKTLSPVHRRSKLGAHDSPFDTTVKLAGTSWVTVRCWEDRPGGRFRFAHGAPFHVDIPGKPLRPRKAEVEYLIKRVTDQIERSKKVLPPVAIAEYEKALSIYREKAKQAR